MSQSEEPKIIVDEDFKAKVEREKEELLKQTAAQSDESESSSPDEPPPASFTTLVSMLSTQALVSMGQLAIPGEEPSVRLDLAKYYIDLLDMLEEKTRRNLLGFEADLLKQSVHQLRLVFIEVNKTAPKAS